MLDAEHLSETVHVVRDEPQRVAGTADSDDIEPARFRFGRDACARFAVHVDDGGRARGQQFGEQPQLLREIVLEAHVIVQVIARDIGEKAPALKITPSSLRCCKP